MTSFVEIQALIRRLMGHSITYAVEFDGSECMLGTKTGVDSCPVNFALLNKFQQFKFSVICRFSYVPTAILDLEQTCRL